MASTIITKYGSGAPLASDLVRGELAVDTENGRLYTETSGGAVIEIGLNPSGNVDVTGTVTADGLTVDSSSGITVNGPTNQDGKLNLVAYAGVQDAEARIQAARGNTTGTDSRLQFLTNNGTSLLTRVDINDNGDISFYEDTGTTAKLFWDASAESLGIGTTNPLAPLDVKSATGNVGFNYGTSASPERGNLWYDTDGSGWKFNIGKVQSSAFTSQITIQDNGNVGIGTTSPSVPLEVNVSGTGDVFKLTRDTGTNGELNIDFSGANANFNSEQGGFTFETSSAANAVTIDSSGNLLVGKTVTTFGNDGHVLWNDGLVDFSRTATSATMRVNKNTHDGDLISFSKDGTAVGSIGSYTGGYLYIGSPAGNDAYILLGADAVLPSTSTGAARDDAISLGNAARRFKDLYLSGGVYVGGTVAANYLDDYEEGTWTASIKYDNPSTGTAATLSESGGTYTKVGRLVTVNAEIDVSSTNSGTGNVYILGLPFTVADLLSPTGQEASGLVGYYTGFSSGVNSLTVGAENLTTYMSMYGLTSSTQTATSNITAAIMGTGELRLSLTYFTT